MHRTKAQAQLTQRRTVHATTLFVVFVCLSLLGVDAWLAWRAREQQLRQAVVSNTNLASAVAQQMDGMLSEVGHLLNSIAFELQLSSMDRQALNRLQPILKNHVDSNQHVHGLFVYDAKVLGSSTHKELMLSTPTMPTASISLTTAITRQWRRELAGRS